MNHFHISANTFSRNLSSFFDDRLQVFGLATSYIELMILLKENESSTQSDIAGRLNLAPSTITRFVDKLIKEKYVKKKRTGRTVSIELTESGRKKSAQMKAAYDGIVDELKDLMGEKYLETVRKLLEFGSEELNKTE